MVKILKEEAMSQVPRKAGKHKIQKQKWLDDSWLEK